MPPVEALFVVVPALCAEAVLPPFLAVPVPVLALFFLDEDFFLAAVVAAGGFCGTAVAAPALHPSDSIAVMAAQLSNVLMDSTVSLTIP